MKWPLIRFGVVMVGVVFIVVGMMIPTPLLTLPGGILCGFSAWIGDDIYD